VALSGKRQEIDLLRAEADDLSKVSYWPADRDYLTAQLTSLDEQCTSLDIKVCDTRIMVMIMMMNELTITRRLVLKCLTTHGCIL